MGIDQLNLHSVQLGYLKILQMGNADPNNTKAGKQIRGSVNPSQLGGRHSDPIVTTPMIALDFSGTTTQSASHNVALISGHKSICQAQYIPQRHDRTFWKLESRSLNQQENNETDFSKKLRTPVATRFHSNANSGLQMGSNRESVPEQMGGGV
ncbi:hypothetical protein F511_28840 [Dorcoceras hygrometricum]|uniref:Uncharacterized protein n=1 Tax=Dorcoceras hygrometricum TaxID=472368 RepID=A0A2Z7CD55_9LAMI|nr:hypothetical protein F511_28840 [Dorcoceras hygrometricum]